MDTIVEHLETESALRGFHIYKNTENWKPVKGQQITFHREFNNVYDRFAVAGRTLLPGRLAPSTVGHVPREISGYIWHASRYGAAITAEVTYVEPKNSPLVQGGLEILIEISIVWDDAKGMATLKEKLETVKLRDYTDELKDILKEMGVEKYPVYCAKINIVKNNAKRRCNLNLWSGIN